MLGESLVTSLSLIYGGAALVATMALFARQQLIIAYMFLGMAMGPYGMQMISDPDSVEQIGHAGMIFLLFLAGLHLDPKNLLQQLQKAVLVTVSTSFTFAVLSYLVVITFTSLSQMEAMVIGASMMFSSTLIGLKLLPTNMLHRQPIGELMISVLIIQDLLAIATMITLKTMGSVEVETNQILQLFLSIPILLLYAFFVERFFLARLFVMFESVREYLFILSVGWCLSVSEIANVLGLSHEIGAFIAGVAIASSSVSTYLAECLNPLRDFLLVLFFFSIGANLNVLELLNLGGPVVLLAATIMVSKPLLYWVMFGWSKEDAPISWEAGVRLGQSSEFSILVSQIAVKFNVLSKVGAALIEATTMLTFMVSSYWVSRKFETPSSLKTTVEE